MLKQLLIILGGTILGIIAGYLIIFYTSIFSIQYKNFLYVPFESKQVYGFLPYWLFSKAKNDYSKYATTISYFSLTIDTDGSIQKFTNPGESEPGWYTLTSGKMNSFFATARKNNTNLSLAVFAGDEDSIGALMSDPKAHAQKLISEVVPLMKKYNFSDLNLDIESADDNASAAAQTNFTAFVKTVKSGLDSAHIGSLTIDISPTDFIKKNLIDPVAVAPYVDKIIIMAYDYHFAGSYVTGPVAPLNGAGTESEFDTEVAVQKALNVTSSQKIILGVPIYGYEWETVGNTTRAAVIPGTGIAESDATVSQFLASCATCSAQFDSTAQEKYVIYKDQETGTYHQIFYPDLQSMNAKIKFANQQNLGGIALWALGYEDGSVLTPLTSYKSPFF